MKEPHPKNQFSNWKATGRTGSRYWPWISRRTVKSSKPTVSTSPNGVCCTIASTWTQFRRSGSSHSDGQGGVSRTTKALLDRDSYGEKHRNPMVAELSIPHTRWSTSIQDIRPQVQDIVLAAQTELKPGDQDHLSQLPHLVHVLPDTLGCPSRFQ